MKKLQLLGGLTILSLTSCLELHAVAYFLVAEVPEQNVFHDSYVLPLIEPNHIAYARRLIREGWQGVMIPYFVEQIAEVSPSESLDSIEAAVREFVERLTGKQTIYQCFQLVE